MQLDGLIPLAHPSTVRLLLLIGLPGSGKSTLAAQLQHDRRRVISTDAIRAQLFGHEEVQGPWIKVWREVEHQFRQTVEQIAAGQVIEGVYDATNVVRRQRRQTIALARTCGFMDIWGIWLQTPLSLCLERNQQRDRQVPVPVLLQMHRRLVGAPPAVDEGLDQLIQI